jgi:hypothetical protein
MTLADFFGEQGLDWKTAMQEIAAERQFAAELGVVVGVERTEGATVIDPVPTSPDPAPEGFSQLDCGTGSGGFKPGNSCAKGGGTGSKKKDEEQKPKFIPSMHGQDGPVRKFEERVKDQKFESALIVDKGGNVILEKDGTKSRVAFNFAEAIAIQQANEPTLTHNHPRGSSFSLSDMTSASDMGLTELRAVTKDGLYVLRKEPGAKQWPSSNLLRLAYDKAQLELTPKYSQAVKNKTMTVMELNQKMSDEICRTVASQLNLYYAKF